MAKTMPNPVWVKQGATSPHNYKPQSRDSVDSKRSYARNARIQGRTIGDLLAECLAERRWQEVIRAK